MWEFLDTYWSFYNVGVLLLLLFGLVLLIKLASMKKPDKDDPPELCFRRLNDRFEKDHQKLAKVLRDKPSLPRKARKLIKQAYKQELKRQQAKDEAKDDQLIEKVRASLKAGKKAEEVFTETRPNVYVLNFEGDLMAHAVEQLREEISFVLEIVTKGDEVVVRLNSPGGMVPQYGLAGAQLMRIRQAGVPLTACVDVVAASGGYLMAAVADKIVASPFAFLGSIGVVAGVPNLHRKLQKNEIDYYLFTAGKYKRTVTPLSEVTDEGKAKFVESLEQVHQAFKQHVGSHRAELNLEEVATGEYWLATEAKLRGLVDEIATSDEYLARLMKDRDVIEIKTKERRNVLGKLSAGVSAMKSWLRLEALPLGATPNLKAPTDQMVAVDRDLDYKGWG